MLDHRDAAVSRGGHLLPLLLLRERKLIFGQLIGIGCRFRRCFALAALGHGGAGSGATSVGSKVGTIFFGLPRGRLAGGGTAACGEMGGVRDLQRGVAGGLGGLSSSEKDMMEGAARALTVPGFVFPEAAFFLAGAATAAGLGTGLEAAVLEGECK